MQQFKPDAPSGAFSPRMCLVSFQRIYMMGLYPLYRPIKKRDGSMVKKVTTKSGIRIPAKYLSGLTGEERKKRIRQLERMRKEGKVLGSLAGDKKAKTRRSTHTVKFEKRFGKS